MFTIFQVLHITDIYFEQSTVAHIIKTQQAYIEHTTVHTEREHTAYTTHSNPLMSQMDRMHNTIIMFSHTTLKVI